MDDYGCPEKRRTKNDDKRKRKNREFKRGGRFRSMNIVQNESR